MIKIITAPELRDRIAADKKCFLLDVREPEEFAYAHIKGSVLIPLRELPERITELDKFGEIVVICHHGVRSFHAANFLADAGFQNVYNLQGGIEAWSIKCDGSVPRY